MAETIKIDYPEYLANAMGLNKKDFGKQIKVSALVKLYELGKISSGTAAKVLQISKLDFLELLNEYKVSFLDTHDLTKDVSNA
jgi:predicted HTH domain antitoxin